MSIEAEAAALAAKYPNKPRGVVCGVERSGYRALIEALDTRGLSAARVGEIIEAEKGIKVSHQTILRHRSRACSCQR